MAVPAETTLIADKRRLLNGQAVTFSGRLRTFPLPAGNKLVEVQVLLSGRWQTFRTLAHRRRGRWSARYRFRRTRGVWCATDSALDCRKRPAIPSTREGREPSTFA